VVRGTVRSCKYNDINLNAYKNFLRRNIKGMHCRLALKLHKHFMTNKIWKGTL